MKKRMTSWMKKRRRRSFHLNEIMQNKLACHTGSLLMKEGL